MPPKEELIRRISDMGSSDLSLDGVKIEPDFGHGNHFFEFYSVLESSPDIELPKDGNYVLLHCSAPEKKDEVYGMLDEADRIETPLGGISVLEGEKLAEFYRRWKALEDFSKRRREFILKEILEDYTVVSNITHQGISRESEVRLGCYDSVQREGGREMLFPIALRWDSPVYVFRGKENLSEEVIGRVGFDARAEELGLMDDLKKINLLPHGGGYKIDLEYTKIGVVSTDAGNHFILGGAKPGSRVGELVDSSKRSVSSFGEIIVMSPRELPFDYRGLSVIEKTMEYGLGTPVAKLQPLMTFKV
jgi:hypothetical protein